MPVYILLYSDDNDNEGIHSLEFNSKTIVLMFEDKDDADRYCGLLEAQDFPVPKPELIDKEEVIAFCTNSGYEAKFVEKGFVPSTDEDRLLLSPPERNLDVSTWQDEEHPSIGDIEKVKGNLELDNIRQKLEDLL